MKLFRIVSIMLLVLFTCSLANAVVMSQKQARIILALRLGGMVGATGQLVLDGMQNVYYYDTAVELLAATPTEGVIGWAIDTNVIYFYTGSAWVALASADGFTGTNGGTFGNETDTVWTLAEFGEDITFTFAGNLVTIASGTSATFVITPALSLSSTLGVTGLVTALGGITSTAGTNTINDITPAATIVDFTATPQVAFHAKTTGAIMTEVDTEEDYFRIGPLNTYFEIFQDGNNSDCVGSWGDGLTGWIIPGANAADQGVQLTEGISLGTAHSFVAQTTAIRMQVAFLVATRAQFDVLQVGFRGLAAYEVGDDDTEWLAAYDDKVTVGLIDNAGVIRQLTSVATSDVTTACTHAAAVDGDILALQIDVSTAGATSVSVGTATPAGGTTAQTQAAVTAALADLTLDTLCQVTTVTLTAGTYVPTIAMAKAAGGVSTLALAYYYVGPQ